VAFVFLVVLLASPTAGAQSEPPSPGGLPADFFGMNTPVLYQVTADDPTVADATLAAIAGLGVGQARYAPVWAEVEPFPPESGAHYYRFDNMDARVAALARAGLRFYPVLAYGNRWATGDIETGWMKPPLRRHIGDFAAYGSAIVARYGTHGHFWSEHPEVPYLPAQTVEVWNEPNLSAFWGDGKPNPARYGRMYLATARAIRSLNPETSLVFGSLSPGLGDNDLRAIPYLRAVLERVPKVTRFVSRVGFHPYGSSFEEAARRLRRIRRFLNRHKLRRAAIEISEDGMTTPDDPARAEYLRMMVSSVPNSGCRISHYSIHTWQTAESNPADEEDWYGIANADGALKPSGQAFQHSVRTMRGLEQEPYAESPYTELRRGSQICRVSAPRR
jgi:hypothetical protein